MKEDSADLFPIQDAVRMTQIFSESIRLLNDVEAKHNQAIFDLFARMAHEAIRLSGEVNGISPAENQAENISGTLENQKLNLIKSSVEQIKIEEVNQTLNGEELSDISKLIGGRYFSPEISSALMNAYNSLVTAQSQKHTLVQAAMTQWITMMFDSIFKPSVK